MKYILRTVVLALLITINVSPQVPAQIIPEFTFKKINKTTFSNRNLESDKL
jgi:hypothetical protein